MIQIPPPSPAGNIEKRKTRRIALKSRSFLYAIVGVVSLLVGVFLGAFLLKGEPRVPIASQRSLGSPSQRGP